MSTKLIRRALIAAALFVGAAAAFSPVAFAQTTTTTNNQEVRNLTITPVTLPLSNINLGAAVSGGSLGKVNVQSNTNFKVQVASTNVSNFKSESGINQIPYTFKYNGIGVVLTATAITAETNADMVLACNNASGCDRPLTVDIAEGARYGIPSGNYTDTLTFTISAP